ncbi:amidohydrolase family protein [Microbacterium sp.]|uniref:amidohydrolase family protein n=1 Tax=Microbacterium sp. TaxID=51671 RepID=UPI003C71E786
MEPNPAPAEHVLSGRPLVFRHATVLTMDDAGVIHDGDVLVIGERIAAVGRHVIAPDDAVEIDASGGILMPGMVDSHRHMWQTAMRGYGGDWTISQYFTFYYLGHGKLFRPEDVYAGNLLSAIEAIDSGVTTTLDWSHGLQTVDHGEAALQALKDVPGRFVLGYGNLLGAPWEWSAAPEFRRFVSSHFAARDDMMGLQLAFDVTGQPGFPEQGAFESARELDLAVTTHAGVWGATTDDGIMQMAEGGYMTPRVTYVHSASLSQDSYQRIAASGGNASVSAESEDSAGQGYPSTHELRRHGIPISLSMDTSVWWSADMFSAMRATVNADRARGHADAHARNETVVNNDIRAEDAVRYATMGGAHALELDDVIGSLTVGKKADIVLLKNDDSPTMTPILNPFTHVVFQAGRGDVHTVVVNGAVVKYQGRRLAGDLRRASDAVAATVEHLRAAMGEDAWQQGMTPELPAAELIPNPYTYTEWDGGTRLVRAEG